MESRDTMDEDMDIRQPSPSHSGLSYPICSSKSSASSVIICLKPQPKAKASQVLLFQPSLSNHPTIEVPPAKATAITTLCTSRGGKEKADFITPKSKEPEPSAQVDVGRSNLSPKQIGHLSPLELRCKARLSIPFSQPTNLPPSPTSHLTASNSLLHSNQPPTD